MSLTIWRGNTKTKTKRSLKRRKEKRKQERNGKQTVVPARFQEPRPGWREGRAGRACTNHSSVDRQSLEIWRYSPPLKQPPGLVSLTSQETRLRLACPPLRAAIGCDVTPPICLLISCRCLRKRSLLPREKNCRAEMWDCDPTAP